MLNVDDIVAHTISKTDEYLKIPSVVGHETPFLDHLYKEYLDLGYNSVRSDNIVMVSGTNPESAYLAAHIDRHGIVSIGGGDYRYAAHAVKNYKYDEKSGSKNLSSLKKVCSHFEAEKVYAYGRWSGDVIADGHVEKCSYCDQRSNLIFKINDMDVMPEGIPVAYRHEALEKGGYISGQIDNAISVGLVSALFKDGFEGTAFFSAEEEIGKSWRYLMSFMSDGGIETGQLIVLDTSPYDAKNLIDEGCVVLRNRDSTAPFNKVLVDKLKSICDQQDIPYDFKDKTLLNLGKKKYQLGRTELGRLIEGSGGRITGATIQIPTFNYHRNDETTTCKAIHNVALLLTDYLK